MEDTQTTQKEDTHSTPTEIDVTIPVPEHVQVDSTDELMDRFCWSFE